MNEVVKFLQENPVQYLATVGRDGKAKCRPFMFAGELDGKLWFCTNNTKDVYKDMQQTPISRSPSPAPRTHGSACTARPCLRTTWQQGNVHPKSDRQGPVRRGCNPIFEVFYLKDAHAVIADFSGNPPQEYTL